MSYWIRLTNEKLNDALIKSGKNLKPDQHGHDYLFLDLEKLKVFWNDKPVSKLSSIEIGSWIRVEPLGKDVANLGKEGRYGEFVKIFNYFSRCLNNNKFLCVSFNFTSGYATTTL